MEDSAWNSININSIFNGVVMISVFVSSNVDTRALHLRLEDTRSMISLGFRAGIFSVQDSPSATRRACKLFVRFGIVLEPL